MKKIAILGATGSIGTQALDIIAKYPEYYKITALSTYENIDLLEAQIHRFKPRIAAVVHPEKAEILRKRLPSSMHLLTGREALSALASLEENDIVLTAVVGIAGLEATLAALHAGIDVALANKEALVAGGALIMDAALRSNCRILPVDSEHSAIFQCLQGCPSHASIDKIHLTASGGPFRTYDKEDLKQVTASDALKHPNWRMGRKITVDCATMMNKGLEVIEAKWLFDLHIDQIEVLVHPQSIIHSMVTYKDGSTLAQMGQPDMRIPILYALSHPERFSSGVLPVDFLNCGPLSFFSPDTTMFPCLALAYKAIKIGGTMPSVLNAANEVAVEMFLRDEIKFMQIPVLVEKAMRIHQVIDHPVLKDILRADRETRELLE